MLDVGISHKQPAFAQYPTTFVGKHQTFSLAFSFARFLSHTDTLTHSLSRIRTHTLTLSLTQIYTHSHTLFLSLLCVIAAFAQYGATFVDEEVTGKRLVRLSEEILKKKLQVTSLGHRKELVRHLDALLRARKAFLMH